MDIIQPMLDSGEVFFENRLFSVLEQDYLNYMLNKSQYSNGLDLRNKYLHSTDPIDENQKRYDYILLMKILILIVLKINHEFFLWDEIKKQQG